MACDFVKVLLCKFRRRSDFLPLLCDRIVHYRPAMPFGNRKKNIFEYLFSSVLLQLKKYHHPGNLKLNNLGISQSLKLRNSMGKILRISLELIKFTRNTLG